MIYKMTMMHLFYLIALLSFFALNLLKPLASFPCSKIKLIAIKAFQQKYWKTCNSAKSILNIESWKYYIASTAHCHCLKNRAFYKSNFILMTMTIEQILLRQFDHTENIRCCCWRRVQFSGSDSVPAAALRSRRFITYQESGESTQATGELQPEADLLQIIYTLHSYTFFRQAVSLYHVEWQERGKPVIHCRLSHSHETPRSHPLHVQKLSSEALCETRFPNLFCCAMHESTSLMSSCFCSLLDGEMIVAVDICSHGNHS